MPDWHTASWLWDCAEPWAIIWERSLTWSVNFKKSDTCTATMQEHDENMHLHLRFSKESHLHNYFSVFSLQNSFLWCTVLLSDHPNRDFWQVTSDNWVLPIVLCPPVKSVRPYNGAHPKSSHRFKGLTIRTTRGSAQKSEITTKLSISNTSVSTFHSTDSAVASVSDWNQIV